MNYIATYTVRSEGDVDQICIEQEIGMVAWILKMIITCSVPVINKATYVRCGNHWLNKQTDTIATRDEQDVINYFNNLHKGV